MTFLGYRLLDALPRLCRDSKNYFSGRAFHSLTLCALAKADTQRPDHLRMEGVLEYKPDIFS